MDGKSPEAILTQPLAWCYDVAVTLACWGYFILAFVFPFCFIYGGAWLLPGSREPRFQRINNLYYRGFFRILRMTAPRHQWRIDEQVKHIRSSVVVCNHLSYLDPLLMLALFPKQKTVVKTNFFKVPIFGWVLRTAGYFPADGEGRYREMMIEQVEGMKKYLADGGIFFIFPEGSRSRDGSIGPLRRGAVKIARLCKAPIHVLHLEGTDRLFTPGKFFFNARKPNTISLRSIDRIEFDPHQSPGDLEQRIHEAMIVGNRRGYAHGMHPDPGTGKMNQ
jgi:1-acyl-sn-glycerol-3-phosphate acyltransferase